jgi:FAD dependent oxidoreductase
LSVRGTARVRSLEELGRGTFDVLVVGAGIIGTRAGLGVALVDAGDFGGATSGASGKLVHGGLRYLKMGRIGLSRRAQPALMPCAPGSTTRPPSTCSASTVTRRTGCSSTPTPSRTP